MRRGWTLYTMHGIGIKDPDKPKTSYWAELYHQPSWRWMIARAYHWYDMHIFKIPGFRWLDAHWGRKRSITWMPISARQDCRCYELFAKGRVTLTSIEIDQALYERMADRNYEP